jgi:hypothetical protein
MSACPQCGSAFKAGRRPQTYCSVPCQSKAANMRTNARRRLKTPEVIFPPQTLKTPLSGLPDSSVATSRHRIGDRIRIWIDSPALGSGERYLIVTAIGPKLARLYSAASLREITISRSEFEEHAQPYDSAPETVLAILKRNLGTYERFGLDHDRPLDRAIEAMRDEAQKEAA